jgi:glycosyltransferase involved in cell wall biosynthesis
MNGCGVLLVGTFGVPGNYSVAEDLAGRLAQGAARVLMTSSKRGRLARLHDTVSTIWRQRAHYSVAQVDVYSGPAFRLAEIACWTLRRAGKPYVLTLRGGNLPAFSSERQRRVRALLSSATCVTTPSDYLLQEMKAYCDNIRLLPNPLSVDAYPYRQRRAPGRTVVWLRAFRTIYNPTLAPRAVSLLEAEFPDVRLLMIGPDMHDGSLSATREAARRCVAPDRVEIAGPVRKADVPAWLARGDVFINTTNVENTPISVLEAMACGLCVVTTNVGGIPYLLTHEHDALLVPPDDPQSMADALRRIWSEPDLAGHLSKNARQTADQYDWSRILPQWESILGAASPRAAAGHC